jgi:hypothetical protein
VVAMSLGPAGVKPPVGLVPAEAELTATKGAIWCGSGESWPRRRKADGGQEVRFVSIEVSDRSAG